MTHVEILLKQITAKHIRPYKEGTEIRVYNLDEARSQIQHIINSQNLNLTISGVDPVLKSIVVHAA